MSKTLHYAMLAAAFLPLAMSAQIPFINQSSLLTVTNYSSGNAVGVCDMNNDKKDDIVRSDNTNMQVQLQGNPNGAFSVINTTYNVSGPWGMCVGDVNNDGYNDALFGDNGATRMLVWNGTGYTGTNVTTATSAGYIFVQGCNYFDINNDAFLDAFVCADTDTNHIYWNNAGTGWTYNSAQTDIPGGCGTAGTGNSFDGSGNYASVWSDINNDGLVDLHITHCRQSVSSSSDWRRIDQVYINNGNGTFTQDVTNWTNLKDGAQGWCTTFGDIDNDGDMDAFCLNYDVNSRLLINDGTGVFTNVMATSGIANTSGPSGFFGQNCSFHDFDNDGNLDLIMAGDDHYLYKGNGDGTFTLCTPQFIQGTRHMSAYGVGDLNSDGFLDVFASYCDIYNTPNNTYDDRVWMNDCIANGNTNNWIKFFLIGGATSGMSNKNGVGAIVKIYGSFGQRIRIIHAGEGYGIQNSFVAHFGIGSATSIDSVVILWPSGIVDKMLTLPSGNQYDVPEGGFPTSTSMASYRPFRMSMGPNPMNDQLTIQMFNTDQYGLDNMSVQIIDMNGRVVYSEGTLSSNIIVIDRASLAAGMYMVEVKNGQERVASEKLMVH